MHCCGLLLASLSVGYLLLLTLFIINPLYTAGLFHCYMLDVSNFHFRGVGFILVVLFLFFYEKSS